MSAYQVCVRGSGIVGKSLALGLARQGLSVAWVGPAATPGVVREDVRTYALSPRSVAFLRSLKVWDGLVDAHATPVQDMRVRGDLGAELHFSAYDAAVPELNHIVDAGALEEALATALRFQAHVTRVDEPVAAPLQAYCEGKHSQVHDSLGVRFERRPYRHTAMAARLVADRPHHGTAWQWFQSGEVVALLPFGSPEGGFSYGLVWSMPEQLAAERMAADADSVLALLQARVGDEAGQLAWASGRASWPLMRAQVDRWAGPGWVLVGDCAHVVHPLAGQGLNLGLGDVQALCEVLAQREAWRDLGDERLLRRYQYLREGPVGDMARVCDGLWQLFTPDVSALRTLRNLGLQAAQSVGPVRQWLMRQALEA
jgi:2-polyprenyl-6-methoxyphenol hydroxylase-like FAD-dependent oxidoreductase